MKKSYDKMSRSEKRVLRVKTDIPLSHVLSSLGYKVREGLHKEQQFPCDLHGDGKDGKPSARLYLTDPENPSDQSWYCFACGKKRDSIETIKDKMGLSFWDALKYLEKTYNLPSLPWTEDDYNKFPIKNIVQEDHSLDKIAQSIHNTLNFCTKDRMLPQNKTLGMWEAYDKISYLHSNSKISDKEAISSFHKIKHHLMESLEESLWKVS
jgi:hypothetical protein